jgi:4-carboxymuconolactone decarboxylase
VRLHHFRPDELDATQRALYDTLTSGSRTQVPFSRPDVRMADAEGRLQGPFNAMLHHPGLGDALQEVSRRLRFEGVLTDRAREIVILIVAASEQSDFEWVAHAAIATTLGISEGDIDALGRRQPVSFEDQAEDAAAALARSLVDTGDADDRTFDHARGVLGDAGVVEVSTTVGIYQLLAQQMRLFRVPSPPGPWVNSG